MNNYSDEQLIVNYLKGDKEALEFLIKRYLKPIYSFIYRYTGSSQDAEDITQATFVKAWRNLKKFDPQRSRFATLRDRQQKSFKTWLFAIAKNTSIDFFKKKKTVPFSAFENDEGDNILINTLTDPSPLPDELLERAEVKQWLVLAMTKLAPKYRMVLFLRYNDHFTFKEIAEALAEPLNTVKSRHRRALIMLKKLLTEF